MNDECVCQGGWMCPACSERVQKENSEMKKRINEACRMIEKKDFELTMAAASDPLLLGLSKLIRPIRRA